MLRALLHYATRLRWRALTQSPPRHPPVGLVRFGSLRRLQPIGRIFGSEWGQCIDRYYIESFLARHATDIHGHVLEIADNTYTRQFGGQQVVQSDVLHVTPGHPRSTITADITSADHIHHILSITWAVTHVINKFWDFEIWDFIPNPV